MQQSNSLGITLSIREQQLIATVGPKLEEFGESFDFCGLKQALSSPDYQNYDVFEQELVNLEEHFSAQTPIQVILGLELFADLELIYKNDSGQVVARVLPLAQSAPYDLQSLLPKIQSLTKTTPRVNESVIEELSKALIEQKSQEIVVAEVIDASINITPCPNSLRATARATRPEGGKELTLEMLKDELAKLGIVMLTEQVIKSVDIEQFYDADIVVAEGQPAVAPIPHSYDYKFSDMHSTVRKERADGSVDFREKASFLVVEQGAVLVEYIPGVPGRDGYDIYNNPIKAAELVEHQAFTEEFEGAVVCPHNPHQLLASRKGHPVKVPDGALVHEYRVFENIDLNTGNIHYDGSVHITGDIKQGSIVNVTGNVLVEGNIYNAKVYAGKEITVNGGILGKEPEKVTQDLQEELVYSTKIKAGKTVRAKFINYAFIKTQAKLEVAEYLMHCKVVVMQDCSVGKDGGRGLITGGQTLAKLGICVKQLGSQAAIKTSVFAGASQDVMQDYTREVENHLRRLQEKQQLQELFKKNKNVPTSLDEKKSTLKMKKIREALDKLEEDISKTRKKTHKLLQEINLGKKSIIQVEQQAFANVEVGINARPVKLTKKVPFPFQVLHHDNKTKVVKS